MKLKLVQNWRSAWKWYSVHIMIVIVALPEIWSYFPQEFKDSLPPGALKYAMMFLGVSAILARMFSQEKLKDDEPDKDV